jgi:uncharacterized protein YoxC
MVEPSFYPDEAGPPQQAVKKQPPDFEAFNNISRSVNNVAANLRILEERYSTLRNKSQVSEQSMIGMEKEIRGDIRLLSDDLLDLKRSLNDIKDKLRLISGEITNLVKKNDFKVVERYVDMWQPMNFVTRNELNNMLEEAKK